LVLPASAYAEALVGPSRRGADAVATLDAFLDALPVAVESATREIARRAASLRAAHGRGLKLPDALVLATASALDADHVLTTDAGWPAVAVDVRVLGPS
jgi:predicted nucleic acid-binding protein